MAGFWNTVGKLAKQHGPTLVRQLQRSGALDKVAGAISSAASGASRASAPPEAAVGAAPPGRPVSSTASPTGSRARRIDYSPDLDGKADPGEIVWTWVTYEEDAGQGKDRPVLVVGRDGSTLLGLMLSSQASRDGQHGWLPLGSGSWDPQGRPSWIRLDRVLDVPESGIRREGSVLPAERFELVAARLRSQYSWH